MISYQYDFYKKNCSFHSTFAVEGHRLQLDMTKSAVAIEPELELIPVPAAPAGAGKTYLMWVGQDHYPTIKAFVDEAKELGISKRVASADLAAKLAQPGTLVFLAHDEGVYTECPKCTRDIENPEHRKAEQAYLAAVAIRTKRFDELNDLKELADELGTDEAKEAAAKAQRLYDNSNKKVTEHEDNLKAIPKSVKAGSGGSALVRKEPGSKKTVRWDYRKYMYWRNQPAKWNFQDMTVKLEMCQHCGGFGRRPVGKVFGLFMPNAAEYILRPEDDATVQADVASKGIATVEAKKVRKEAKRGCGYRHPGGYYLVAETDGAKAGPTPEQLKAAVEQLVAAGLVKPAEVKVTGHFGEFIVPVDIDEKRFRGVKLWTPVAAAAEEADDIVSAVEG